jgi:type I restriction enzyme S subunit
MSKWEWKKLGDLYPIVMGKTPPRGNPSCWDKSKRTNNVWVTIADISSNENQVITESKEYISDKATKNISLVSPKSLLLSFKLSIGKMAFAGVPLYTNEAIVNFPPIKDIDLHYLHKYFLYYNWDKASEGDTKVKGKTLNKEKLKNIDIPIPPLSEQKRIVKFLDEEFSKIDTLKTNAETNLKNAKELFETTLEKELNPLSRHSERSEESSAELPSGWEWKALDEFSTNLDAKRKPVTKKNRVNGNYPYYGASGIVDYVDSYIYDGKYLLISEDGANLVARSTPIAFIAEGKFWVNNHAHIIETANEATLQYLVYFFENLDLSPYVKGMAQPKLSQDSLYKIPIPLPSLSVQKEIVARLDKLSENVKRLEANYKQIIANCDELKKSILKKTFEEKT